MGGRLTPFQDAVLAWGDANRRDLPWRDTRDPWAILVSEVMLQQTQVARVAERWPTFLMRYPTPAAMADVALGGVLREWQGLGYPRRARNLWTAAAQIVEIHGGSVPSELDALLALPGIGPYTARAVRAFAFELDAAVVDTNVARVLARAVAGRSLTAREVQHLADELLPTQVWAWNQALLDLGAGPCGRRAPACNKCPVQPLCEWHRRASTGVIDPADGTAGVSTRQARFAGSNRQGRGAILRAVAVGPQTMGGVALVTGWSDPARLEIVVSDLVAEGLIRRVAGLLQLP